MNVTLSMPRNLSFIIIGVIACGVLLYGVIGGLTQPKDVVLPSNGMTPERQVPNPLIDPLPEGLAPAPAAQACLPGEAEEIVWPTLEQVEPSRASAGEEVHVVGRGGYIICGESSYNESSRNFTLLFDGQPFGEINCYVNRCEARLTIPADATAGAHTIAVEGGSELSIEIALGAPTRRGPSR